MKLRIKETLDYIFLFLFLILDKRQNLVRNDETGRIHQMTH